LVGFFLRCEQRLDFGQLGFGSSGANSSSFFLGGATKKAAKKLVSTPSKAMRRTSR